MECSLRRHDDEQAPRHPAQFLGRVRSHPKRDPPEVVALDVSLDRSAIALHARGPCEAFRRTEETGMRADAHSSVRLIQRQSRALPDVRCSSRSSVRRSDFD